MQNETIAATTEEAPELIHEYLERCLCCFLSFLLIQSSTHQHMFSNRLSTLDCFPEILGVVAWEKPCGNNTSNEIATETPSKAKQYFPDNVAATHFLPHLWLIGCNVNRIHQHAVDKMCTRPSKSTQIGTSWCLNTARKKIPIVR